MCYFTVAVVAALFQNVQDPALIEDPAKDPHYAEAAIDAMRTQKDQVRNFKLLQCQSRQLMHCNTLKQDNDSTVRGDGGSRVGEVRAGTTSLMPEHKGFMLQ